MRWVPRRHPLPAWADSQFPDAKPSSRPPRRWALPQGVRPSYTLPSGGGTLNVTLFETLNFIDGQRSIKEIRDAVSAEYDPVPLDVIEELMDAMAQAGLVEIKSP